MTGEQPMESEQIFSLLGVRAGMSDAHYFVGRRQQLSSLSMCYFGDGRRSSVWIYGPRRIGKTSLADITAMKATDNNTRVIKVDAIDISENYFETLLSRAVGRFKSHFDLVGHSSKEKFESLAKSSIERPVLLIFDEMDKVAVHLKTNEQAFLRRLDAENEHFCYCFISCHSPGLIIEEVPEINSRLLGVCEQHKVGPLEQKDVKILCTRVGEDLNNKSFFKVYKDIWSKVGGFPIAVNTLAKSLAISFFHDGEICQNDIEELFDDKFHELKVDLSGLWNSLNSKNRMVLLDKIPSKECEQSLREDGFYSRKDGVVKPKFLIKVGDTHNPPSASNSSANDIYAIVSELMKLLSDINQNLLLKGFNSGFYLGQETITHWRLSRNTCSETEFNDLFNYLYQVFFEGARKRKSSQSGKKEYRLPEPVGTQYKSSRVIGVISNLRNFNFHDFSRSSDSEKPNKYYMDAGKIFNTYCGNELPYNEELRITMRNGIVKDLVTLLESINENINTLELVK